MIKIRPYLTPLEGHLYFRDANEVESRETVCVPALIDVSFQDLYFAFQDRHICFSLERLYLIERAYPRYSWYGEDQPDITITYFFAQNLPGSDDGPYFMSFVFDMGEGLNYQVYRVQGFFPNNSLSS